MNRTLRYGSTGIEVRLLQHALNFQMSPPLAPVPVDGVFGITTLARVQELQRRHQMKPNGVVGPATWCAVLQIYTISGRILILPSASAPRLPLPTPLASNGACSGNGPFNPPS